ncbi:trehalose-phosphatase [Herbaspirillum sp. HC18]|nr:trehalose-phosphatase [Herbaspirillum sp. HC18]
MQPLFSEAGVRRLHDIAGPGLLCAFDFDGTLAPIVPRPEQAWIPRELAARLQHLSGYAPLAVITGRSLENIRSRLPFEPDFIVGNHGQEGLPGWEARAADHERICSAWMSQLARSLDSRPEASGIELEDKRYSLSVHYRRAPGPEQAREFLDALFLALDPQPRVVAGKYVYNLVPGDACHKGDALEHLMQACGAKTALYAGDDVTDEDVFRIKRPGLLSVRIEPDANSAAEFYIPRFEDMARLLDDLAALLHARGARNWLRDGAARTA